MAACPEHHHARTSCPLARPKHQIRWTSLPMTHTSTSPDLPAYGRTKTSNSPDLAAYGRTETSNSPDLPAYGRTVRQTCVRPAGPPCLWPDRPPALELTKLLNGGKGCSRRKHGYRKESGSRALLAFLLPLALYARVLSKPGQMEFGDFFAGDVSPAVWVFLNSRCFTCSLGMAPS